MQIKSLMAWAAALAAAAAAGAASDNSGYVLAKIQLYFQYASTPPIPSPSGDPYVFSARAELPATLTMPGGAVKTLPLTVAGNYEFDQAFATEAGMNAAFPAGTYMLSGAGFPTVSYTFTNTLLFPSTIPQLSSGTWVGNVLSVDPTQAVTLDLNTFTGYGMQGVAGFESISVTSLTAGDNVSLEQNYASSAVGSSTVSATPFTSYTIPANTLSPGLAYLVTVFYATLTSTSSTAVPNAVVSTSYTNRLDFFIGTQSSPSVPAPTVATQPSDEVVAAGASVTFSVGVTYGGSSTAPANVGFIWHANGLAVNIDGTNHVLGADGSLTINNAGAADAGTYYASIITASGATSSHMVTLTVTGSTPVFSVQPTPVTVASGSTAVFSALASGGPTYQWYRNGVPIPSGTSATLVVGDATAANAGAYTCTATNPGGAATSSGAMLTVVSTNDPGRLVNISCRATVGTGANILIAGFAVGGAGTSGTEALLIRGSGPALAPFGVTGTLPDPQLTLYSGTTVVGMNSGWAGSAAISSAAASVGAFAWSNTSSHDAALLESLSEGPYTAQIAGESGDTGIALAEVYDATPAGGYTLTSPRIVNISARVQVGTGGNILIAGFAIGGSTSRTVLIRASGPALAAFGVGGTLPDPQLQLYSGTTVLASNSGWGGNAQIAAVAASVGAFAWSSASSKDSAILITLPPGAYTAQVSGASGDTGVALVEVYEVP
jgi:hypothetical protein